MTSAVKAKPEVESTTRLCPQFRVIFHNDNKTTFDFVILVLIRFFNKAELDAVSLAAKIHVEGSGCVGIYPLEVAEFKRDQAVSMARASKFPLQITIEPD